MCCAKKEEKWVPNDSATMNINKIKRENKRTKNEQKKMRRQL